MGYLADFAGLTWIKVVKFAAGLASTDPRTRCGCPSTSLESDQRPEILPRASGTGAPESAVQVGLVSAENPWATVPSNGHEVLHIIRQSHEPGNTLIARRMRRTHSSRPNSASSVKRLGPLNVPLTASRTG